LDHCLETGKVGKHLKQEGFDNIVKFDFSRKNLESAVESNSYSKIQKVEEDDDVAEEDLDHYDYVMTPSSDLGFDKSMLEKLHKYLKVGGQIII